VPVSDGATRPRPGWTEIAVGAVGYVALTVLALVVLAGSVVPATPTETTALDRYGAWFAVLGSSLVFALAHGVSIVLPAAFVLGVINAMLLRRSGSVWPGVVAHGVNNALVFGLTAILL